MEQLLTHAGAPVEARKLLKDVVDTCRTCRMWTRPRPKSVASTHLATSFNEIVQWNILFHKDHMVSCLIDEAIRWTAGGLLPNKEAVSLIAEITQSWLRPFGGMKVLVSDRESGLLSEEVAQWLDRWGVELKTKRRVNMHKSWRGITAFYES